MLSELQKRSVDWHLDVAVALVLTLGAFAVRIHNVGFNSLSEDETAKWSAVQQYRRGHFVGVNAEHPMLMKTLAWASLGAGEHWNQVAFLHGWPSMSPEGWLRLPNVLLGAATTAILYLICRHMMGIAGSFAAGFFWAFAPLPIALNRLVKEETPLTFFTLLGCYFYLRAKQANEENSTQRWHDLSAIGFGLSFGSQYILHLLGMNGLAWHLAGRAGLDRKRFASGHKRFFLLVFLTLALVNPVILSPSNLIAVMHWLHHDGVHHSGYDFDGTLYVNFPSHLLTGVPWYFYFWLLAVKTPIPILAAIVVGSIFLLRDRKTLASCFFFSFGLLQLASLSICGAKWIRYSLPLLPFLFLAGGYAVQQTWNWLAEEKMSPVLIAMAAVVLFGWPLFELQAWTPYYPFYLNSIGGGASHITRYFAPDEVAEFDSREVAQQVCSAAPTSATLATGRPNSMTHYLERCGRSDIRVVPLYDPLYAPREGDLIDLEPSRRFFETQRFFAALEHSGMRSREIRWTRLGEHDLPIRLIDGETECHPGTHEGYAIGKPTIFLRHKNSWPKLGDGAHRFHLAIPREAATMTHYSQWMNSHARWLLRTSAILLVCLPAVAQQGNSSAPLTADDVMQRVVAMNEVRAKALETYSSLRSYHLECHCLSHKKADMVVRADYYAPNKKELTIVSESGSGTLRNHVFKKLLKAEQESMREDNQQRSAMTPENYTFQLLDYKKADADEFYVLEAKPRAKNKFLVRGRIWVNAKDFAVTRVEGELAVNPSWWTLKTDFKRSYQKVGDFWLPKSNESETKVRIFGTAVLTINYGEYQITEAPGVKTASSSEKPSNGE